MMMDMDPKAVMMTVMDPKVVMMIMVVTMIMLVMMTMPVTMTMLVMMTMPVTMTMLTITPAEDYILVQRVVKVAKHPQNHGLYLLSSMTLKVMDGTLAMILLPSFVLPHTMILLHLLSPMC